MVLVTCSSTKNLTTDKVVGKYRWNGIYGVGSTIELKADYTFEYNWQAGLMQGTTVGSWQKVGSRIILNSERQPPIDGNEDFEIISTEQGRSDSLSIKIVDTADKTVPFASCALKTNTTTLVDSSTDLQGEVKLPRLKADSLLIAYIGYKTIRLKLDTLISFYKFKMKKEHEHYKYFTNEKWEFKNDRLFDPSIKKNKYVEKDYYERVE